MTSIEWTGKQAVHAAPCNRPDTPQGGGVQMTDTPETGAAYLIAKGGAYYRPNSRGYTTSAIQAGRYTLSEADSITHPNGPDGPRDGMRFIHEDEVRCGDYDEVKRLRARIAELEAAVAHQDGAIVVGMEALKKAAENKAAASLPMAVEVKPLVWERGYSSFDVGHGFTAYYEVDECEYDLATVSFGILCHEFGCNVIWKGPKGEAKAAAQADYERRILSSITNARPASEVWNEAIEAAEAVYVNYGYDFNAHLADQIRALKRTAGGA